MPTVKPTLRRRMRMFTKQDYLKGKCTKDGFPLKEGEENAPIEEATPSINIVSDTVTEGPSTETVIENVDVTVDAPADDNEEVVETELDNDPIDSEEGEDNADGESSTR